MSTHANVLMQSAPPKPGNIRYLALRADGRQLVLGQQNKSSGLALGLVVILHVAAIYWLQTHKVELAKIEAPKPMMVSLLAAAQPVVAQIVPVIPKPVVHKPQPRIEKVVPKPVQQETPAPVAQQMPPPEVAPNNAITPAVETPSAVEAKIEPKVVEEPKIEPPRFGVAYLNNPPPAYPPISRRLGEEGHVVLKVLVNAAGEPESVALENGSGSDRLDQAALDVVKKWRFVPAKRNGQALSAYVLVPLKFSLRG